MSDCSAHKRLIFGDSPSQAISKSMTALEASSFPSVFKEGWLRLNKKVPFLSGADVVVSKFQRKLRCATRIFIRRLRDLLLTTPSAPLRNEIFLLMAQPPLLENGGEWTRLETVKCVLPVFSLFHHNRDVPFRRVPYRYAGDFFFQ